MRRLLLLAAVLSLGACNAAVSDKPLFRSGDARGAPVLKPGLWAMLQNEQCAFDAAHPPTPWPECAKPMRITATTLAGPEDSKPPMAYVFARGDPRILQLAFTDEEAPSETFWIYLGVTPDAGDGPVTAATAWLVQCGPPPEAQPSNLTEQPLAGMSIRDKTCFAADAAAIRGAAGPSREWGDAMRMIWVAGPVR